MGHHFSSSAGWTGRLMGWSRGGYGMMGLGSIFNIIALILFLYLIIYIWRKNRVAPQENQTSPYSEETALQILEKEFARGNISEEDFLRKKAYLGHPEYRSKKRRI